MTRWLVAFLAFVFGLLPLVARADNASCYAAGKAQCDNDIAHTDWPYVHLDSCTFRHDSGTVWVAIVDFHYGNVAPGSPQRDTPTFQCAPGETPEPPPDDHCSQVQPYSGAFAGKLAAGSTMCQGDQGGQGCVMSFTPDQDPFLNRTGTQWASHGTYSPTGSSCTPGQVGGGAPPPAPPAAPTRSCGDVSCHDSTNNTTCSDSAAGSNCLTGPQINSPGGGCSTLGDNTICGGSPSAPVPPAPPASPISDPTHEIIGTDHYTYGSPSGGNYTTTITTYGAGQAPSSSGQKPGDDGPAPASSSGGQKGDGTTANGGGDCNSPPVVNGSGGLNAVAYQTWKTRCAVEGNKLGTGTPNTLGQLYTPSTDTTASVVAEFQAKVQQTPVASAVTGYFQVGAVGGSCPVWVLPASEWLPAQTFDFYCRAELADLLDMARLVVLIACAYTAFRIAMGDS